MNQLSFIKIWTYVGPVIGVLIGAVLGFLGKLLLAKRKEIFDKIKNIQTVECVELVNTKVFDREMLGPIAHDLQIKIHEAGPTTKLVEVDEIYFARYRIRNLSDTPISNLLIRSGGKIKSVTFSL